MLILFIIHIISSRVGEEGGGGGGNCVLGPVGLELMATYSSHRLITGKVEIDNFYIGK